MNIDIENRRCISINEAAKHFPGRQRFQHLQVVSAKGIRGAVTSKPSS